MPTELEQRLRSVRPEAPAFSEGARDRARNAALDARSHPRHPHRPRAMRLARPARIVLGGLGFAGLAGLIALLVVSGPHADQSAGLRFADRTEGGVALLLKVSPIAGSGLHAVEAAAQATDAILSRARVQGIEGVQARARDDGTIEAWVPVARTSQEVDRLLVPIRLFVYSLDRDMVVRARTARQALLRAGAAASGSGPKHWFLVTGRGNGLLTLGPAPSRRALIARAGGQVPVDSATLAIPASDELLRDARTREWVVVRDRPVLEGADIAGVDRRSRGLSIRLTPVGAERLRRTIGALDPGGLVLAFDQYLAPGQLSIAGSLSAIGSGLSAGLDLPSPAPGTREILVQNAPSGPLSVRISPVDEAATGPPRPRIGVSIAGTALSRSLAEGVNLRPDSALPDPVVGSFLLEVRLRRAGRGTTSVVTGVNRQGRVFEMLVDQSGRPVTISGGGSGCQLTPWDPQVSLCMTGGLIGSGNLSAYGRVESGARRVEVELSDGRRQRAAVANGWWLSVTGSPVRRILAYDVAGNLVATAGGG